MIPLAEIKAWLGVTATADDDLLTQLEKRMVALVEHWTGKYLGAVAPFVEIFDGGGRERLWLRSTPADLDDLVVSTRPAISEAWSAVDSTDVEVDGRSIIRKSTGIWPKGRRNIQVAYTAGYVVGQEPQLEKQVILELITRNYLARGSETVSRERLGDLEVEYRPYKDVPDPLTLLPRRSAVR